MCDECEYFHNCVHAARICRDILRTGDFKSMTLRFNEKTRNCQFFIPGERRRYA